MVQKQKKHSCICIYGPKTKKKTQLYLHFGYNCAWWFYGTGAEKLLPWRLTMDRKISSLFITLIPKTKEDDEDDPCICILDPLQDFVLQSQLLISHRPPSSPLSRAKVESWDLLLLQDPQIQFFLTLLPKLLHSLGKNPVLWLQIPNPSLCLRKHPFLITTIGRIWWMI